MTIHAVQEVSYDATHDIHLVCAMYTPDVQTLLQCREALAEDMIGGFTLIPENVTCKKCKDTWEFIERKITNQHGHL